MWMRAGSGGAAGGEGVAVLVPEVGQPMDQDAEQGAERRLPRVETEEPEGDDVQVDPHGRHAPGGRRHERELGPAYVAEAEGRGRKRGSGWGT
jgi:hypothetical protein